MEIKVKQKGITMTALIITIIISLILCGVVITIALGKNGAIKKANEAQIKSEIAKYSEELELSVLNAKVDKKGNRTEKFNETEYKKIKEIIPSFDKKYEDILIVKDDKITYLGTDIEFYELLLSMGVMGENVLLDDQILEELQPFITEWTVNDNDTITLPIEGVCDFEVDYGDGTGSVAVTNNTDEDRIHTYENAGTYIVTIKGKCQQFNFQKHATSKDKITKIIQWGALGEGLTSNYFSFYQCVNLQGEIPSPSLNSFKNVTSFETLFQGCSSLTGNIPENLFANCSKVVKFGHGYWSGCFSGCKNLTGNIPEKLFANCPNVIQFNCVFSGCEGLTGSIPENLFKNNTKVQDFQYAFQTCIGLTGNIPEKLFVNCTEVKYFNNTFYKCLNLSGNIPENLFANCSKVGDFSGLFDECKSLTGSIPESLFANCSEVTNFASTFKNCKALTGNIPEKLFENCSKITTLGRSYYSRMLLWM